MYMKNNISISILIPCYNWDVYHLIYSLQQLCVQAKNLYKFEILCIEDGSDQFFLNKKIANLKHVKYKELSKNIGRSKIRNMMAKKALHDWLLFIDADSKIIRKSFVQDYIDHILNHNKQKIPYSTVYYGATMYSNKKPEKNKKLHWTYGSKIESQRKKNIFCSHHFLIARKYFKKDRIQFNEQIQSYGYEDVFFVLENNLKSVYIQTPLLHVGIKKNSEFINHTEQALKNLNHYHQKIKNSEKKIKILRFQKILSTIMLTYPIIILFTVFKLLILKNLKSNTPSMWLFQFYKLGYLLHVKADD